MCESLMRETGRNGTELGTCRAKDRARCEAEQRGGRAACVLQVGGAVCLFQDGAENAIQ